MVFAWVTLCSLLSTLPSCQTFSHSSSVVTALQLQKTEQSGSSCPFTASLLDTFVNPVLPLHKRQATLPPLRVTLTKLKQCRVDKIVAECPVCKVFIVGDKTKLLQQIITSVIWCWSAQWPSSPLPIDWTFCFDCFKTMSDLVRKPTTCHCFDKFKWTKVKSHQMVSSVKV